MFENILKIHITIYFYDITYENSNIDEYIVDIVRDEYNLPLDTTVDVSCFEIDEELHTINPEPIYVGEFSSDITEEEFEKIAEAKIIEHYGFNIPRKEWWYQIFNPEDL